MRTQTFATAVVAVLSLGQANAMAQFQPPQNSQALEETGTLEEMQGALVLIRDSKKETWLLHVGPDTKVTVTGDAETDALRSGMYVQFTAEVDEDGALAKPISAIEIISDPGKDGTGFFPPPAEAEEGEEAEEQAETTKPIRKPEAGTYRVRGKLVSFRNDKIVVVAGRRLEGEAAEDLKVTLHLADASIAQYGDEVAVKAWFYPVARPQPARNVPGKAMAEELSIKLSKPLAAEQGKRKPSRRPVKEE